MDSAGGILYLVATPIGNLSDISVRACKILESVDLILCEDTRTTGLLLHHFNIKKPLQSFHSANENKKSSGFADLLVSGKSVALVSDAGTPLISDPGFPLVRDAIQKGIRIEGIPGPSALINALVLSGFSCEPFSFYGFLPEKEKKRKDLLSETVSEKKTIIFYESPYRILRALKDLSEIFGSRRISVAREMTKKFEEVVRGTAAEVLQHFENKTPKGEFVIVVEGCAK